MGFIINLIAVLVAIVGVLAVVADGAYLKLLDSVAKKRPGGEVTRKYVSKQWPAVGVAGAGSLVALLMTTGGSVMDVIAVLLALVAGGAAATQLKNVHRKYGESS
ncbi:hypothetical protein CLV47_105167 [Antricoccus suffuscus]|uniref:Uncharacterized protein n=1 Tax=Antricoccus suffuscus TaxID=1629062 RepID=A0A2T1A1R9_9ACTN|nr:hypothetical protein [Antricoccus suffuscus]PRZ42545.1 hypothetical protein CLV47_105167 [Antricoccus suffuscus]